jgi:hypothetical protein
LFLSLFNSHIDLHLKVLINFFFFFFIIISISISISISSIISIIIITIIIIVIVLLLFIIYTINLPVVRSRSCRVIYYFDTPTLGKRHQSFGCVTKKEFYEMEGAYVSKPSKDACMTSNLKALHIHFWFVTGNFSMKSSKIVDK